jgi:hypothetical protein
VGQLGVELRLEDDPSSKLVSADEIRSGGIRLVVDLFSPVQVGWHTRAEPSGEVAESLTGSR